MCYLQIAMGMKRVTSSNMSAGIGRDDAASISLQSLVLQHLWHSVLSIPPVGCACLHDIEAMFSPSQYIKVEAHLRSTEVCVVFEVFNV